MSYHVTRKGDRKLEYSRTFQINEIYINVDFYRFPNVAIIRLDKRFVPNFPTNNPTWRNKDLQIKSIFESLHILLYSF